MPARAQSNIDVLGLWALIQTNKGNNGLTTEGLLLDS